MSIDSSIRDRLGFAINTHIPEDDKYLIQTGKVLNRFSPEFLYVRNNQSDPLHRGFQAYALTYCRSPSCCAVIEIYLHEVEQVAVILLKLTF
jgi:hypothetical protein